MGNPKDDERAAAAMAAEYAASSLAPLPSAAKPKVDLDAVLHLACEGDTLTHDDLEIAAESLPLFDTHGSRHLG